GPGEQRLLHLRARIVGEKRVRSVRCFLIQAQMFLELLLREVVIAAEAPNRNAFSSLSTATKLLHQFGQRIWPVSRLWCRAAATDGQHDVIRVLLAASASCHGLTVFDLMGIR